MRKYFLLTLFIALPLFLLCQNISVKSFRLLDNDLDALVNYPVIDRSNGEKAALIKIVTTETGFEFGGGQLGIVKVVQKTAEVWVYVPAKLKAITIAHPKLGQLPNRFYNFEIPIVSGKVYEMVLVTGTVETTVKPIEIAIQWLAINSTPQGASVFIEEQLVGTTPFSRKYPEGEYAYRLELPKYNSQAGKVILSGEKKVLDLVLKPHFGNIKITSSPENGMMIYLDDENTGKTTLATLAGVASGEHTLKLVSQWYQPQSKKVTVTDEGTASVDFTMTPAFADITVITNPTADILIDGKKVGNGNYASRILAGIYSIKADKEKHYSDQQQVTIVAGGKQTIALTLKPMNGSIDITSTPFDATITIDGKEYGTTPNTVKNLLVGDYTLTLKKTGYGTITKTITVKENATAEVNEPLPTGLEITIGSTPAGAQLWIDGVSATTPWTGTLAFGNHSVKLVNSKKVVEETITVTQNGNTRFKYNVAEGLTDADGNTYKTVTIGNQEWMVENLKTTKYSDGTPISKVTDNDEWAALLTEAYCWYDNDFSKKSTYGALYNWYAVVDSRDLCPSGWHVPTDAEWTTLTEYLGGSSVVGGKLKATTPWNRPNTDANNRSGFTGLPNGYRNYGNTGDNNRSGLEGYRSNGSTDANNRSGFTALPGGYRTSNNGKSNYIGYYGYWWSSTDYNATYAWYRGLYYDNSEVVRGNYDKSYGFSVRCLRDL